MNVCLHEKLYGNNKRRFIKMLKKKKSKDNLRTSFVEFLSYKGVMKGVASVHPRKT